MDEDDNDNSSQQLPEGPVPIYYIIVTPQLPSTTEKEQMEDEENARKYPWVYLLSQTTLSGIIDHSVLQALQKVIFLYLIMEYDSNSPLSIIFLINID